MLYSEEETRQTQLLEQGKKKSLEEKRREA
jgi:hypothetical protein